MSSDVTTFRIKRFPSLFLYLMGGFIGLIGAIMLVAVFDPRAKSETRGVAIGISLVTGLVAWAFFAWGRRLARAFVTISPEGLALRALDFKIWGFRRLKQANLRWDQVRAVQLVEIPNPYAPDGMQRDYVIHTTEGNFAIPNVLWPEAKRAAAAIAERVGLPIDDLPPDVAPIPTDEKSNRVGIITMRAFGWLSTVCGVLFALAAVLVAFGKKPDSFSTAAKVGFMASIMVSGGHYMRHFKLGGRKAST